MSYVAVGLGNPGDEYVGTRHNTGRAVVQAFAKMQKCAGFELDKKTNAWVAEGKAKKTRFILVLPDTFMNKSGNVAARFVKSKKAAEKLLVIHDDLDLPLGRFKISFNRGSGGHKGVESVIRAVKTEGFVRIRVGISKDAGKGKVTKPSSRRSSGASLRDALRKKPVGEKEVGDFILGKYKPAELSEFKKVTRKICEALEMIITEGRERAMEAFNRV